MKKKIFAKRGISTPPPWRNNGDLKVENKGDSDQGVG